MHFLRGRGNPDAVVLYEKDHGQFPLEGEGDTFEKIPLPGAGIADGGEDDVRLFVQLERPGKPVGREEGGTDN